MRKRNALLVAVSTLVLSIPATSIYAAGRPAYAAPRSAPVHFAAPAHAQFHTPAPRSITTHHFTRPSRPEARNFRNHDRGVATQAAPAYITTGDSGDDSAVQAVDTSSAPDTRPVEICPPPRDLHAEREAARLQLEQVEFNAEVHLNSTPQWIQVNSDLVETLAEMDADSARVERLLEARADYQQALADKQQARNAVDALSAAGDVSITDIMPAARRALDAANKVTQMQIAALKSDPAYQQTRNRLLSLASIRTALANQLPASVQNDPVWQEAKRQLNALG